MKKFFLSVLSTLLVITIISACSDNNDSSTGPGSSYNNAIITHWGFDFSVAKADTTWDWEKNKNDGETIGWSPTYNGDGTGVWFRTRVEPNRTQSLGKVDITSVTSVDTLTSAWDTNPPPLSKGDVVVAQCLDGFVKFLVTADIDTSEANYDWGVQVRYLFSSLPSFPE